MEPLVSLDVQLYDFVRKTYIDPKEKAA